MENHPLAHTKNGFSRAQSIIIGFKFQAMLEGKVENHDKTVSFLFVQIANFILTMKYV